MRTVPEEHFDHSGAIQGATSWLLRATNEIEDGINLRFDDEIGVATRRNGYVQEGDTLQSGKDGLGLHEAKFSTGAKTLAAINNSGDTATVIKHLTGSTWADLTLPAALASDTQVNFADSLDETYAAGISDSTRMDIINIKKDLTTSLTRNLIGAPKARFVTEYGGSLYAANVELDGTVYPDRAYKSSPPLSVVTYVRGAQSDVAAPTNLVDNVPTMTSATTPAGTVFASSSFATHDAYKAFSDTSDRPNSWFTASGSTGHIGYDFGSGNGKVITYYSMQGPADQNASTAGDITRSPKTWTFEGSNDGSSYTVLQTNTNVPAWTAGEVRTYSVTNTTSYRYYRINVSVNQGGDLLHIAELQFLTSGTTTKPLLMKVDTVRYIKPGMIFDIYTKNTSTKLFDVTVSTVDKSEDSFTFLPFSYNITTSSVDATTNVITLPSTANFPTGTKVAFDATASVPGGLTADTIYYAINVSGTTIKVATTYDNALLANAIDITSTGSGTIRVRLSYDVDDNDEIYLNGRYGELSYLWNTDYPSADKADFLKIPSGASSNSEIIGYGQANDRLFFFTDSSTHKWDQATLKTLYKDIGCANHETIVNVGDWLIWLDSETRVIARNDSTGQQEFISKAVRKKFLQYVPSSNYAECAAGKVNNVYKLHLGTVTLADGSTVILRLAYDFDANNWTRENHRRKILQHMNSDRSGYTKLYFLDDTGKLFKDDQGDLDDTETIPFMIRYGRNNSGSIMLKNYSGLYIVGQNISGAAVRCYLDGKPTPIELGTLTDNYSEVRVGNKPVKGRDINVEITHNGKGSPIAIEGYVPFLSAEEKNFG